MRRTPGQTHAVPAAALLALGLLIGRPAGASAGGGHPPASETPASDKAPTRWGLGSCEEMVNGLDASIQKLLKDAVWCRPTAMGGFIFKLQGTQPFGVCSEFFNFLVVEGLYPFKQEAFTQDCVTMLQRYLRSFQYDDCPNAAAIQQRISESCRNGMRERVQLLNSHAEEVFAAYRKCHEFGWGYVTPPPPPEAGLDALPPPPPTPTPPATPPPPDATPQSPVKDAARPPIVMDTMPVPPGPHGPPPSASVGASCCERCPSTARDRYYVPMAPDTDCRPGDARRDDLSVAGGTCANPLVERPGPSTYGQACCDKKTAQVLYDSVSSDGVTSQVGGVLRSTCGDDPCAGKSAVRSAGIPTYLETSILSTGTDTHGRNWVPESPILRLGKEHLRPCHTEPFYVIKESSAKVAAVAIITAIGSQYEEDARRAEESPGSACHAQEDHRSPAKQAADRAARGAAMGLLASQAKGQIEGLRATFNVTGREQQLPEATLQALIVNEITQQKVPMRLPVRFERDDAGSP